MELRGENDIRAAVSSYGHPHLQSSGRNGGASSPVIISYNAASITPQTLDHHHHPIHHPSNSRSPNPDRLAIVSTGSNSKPPTTAIRYRECLRNHAASVGGNVFDGCGEFMPGGDEGTLEALKCAACDCHRNFHRKEVDGGLNNSGLISPVGGSRRSAGAAAATMIHSLQLPPAPHRYSVLGLHSCSPTAAQPMSVAFGGGGGTESSSEDLNYPFQTHHGDGGGGLITAQPPHYLLSKKRYRTKFSGEQKDKMMEFAEKVGWRINKQDEEEVERFCAEVGVTRQVFKVWMHNNKNVKKQLQQEDDHHQQAQDQEEQ